jgi:hypothetical protein
MPSVADDLVYSADPVLWAREVLGRLLPRQEADALQKVVLVKAHLETV